MKKKSLSATQLLLACILLTCFVLLVCRIFSVKQGQNAYEEFCQTLYENELTANTLCLHYSLADPSAFDVSDYPVRLPVYEAMSELSRAGHLSKTLSELRSLSKKGLSHEDLYALDCLERLLSLSLKEASFPYYSDPLSPSFGVQGTLPILLSEYTFRTRRDVDEYLELLRQTGACLTSMLTYARERSAAGLPPCLSSLKATERQCDTFVSLDALQTGHHFLQTTFEDRLLNLSESVPLTSREMQAYLEQNEKLLETVVAPAYQTLRQGLTELEDRAVKAPSGLAGLPHGKDYYACLLALETGSGKTPEEVRALLEQTLVTEYDTLTNLAKTYPGFQSHVRSGSYEDLGFDGPDSVLGDLAGRIGTDFPSLSTFTGSSREPFSSKATTSKNELLHTVTVKDVVPSLQEFAAPAFYLTAPIDAISQNVIYVNPRNAPTGLELYTTLAHEGFPGHLYQNACMGTHFTSMKDSRLRQLISCGGYVEGWATYVEQLSYVYAAKRLSDLGRSADSLCVLMEKHHRSMMLCLYSLLDVKIHYDGAVPSDVTAFLAPFGITDEETILSIYAYICEAPCNYLKYYLGYLEIEELREAAREKWGDDYSSLRFHKFLLEWGPADFESLRHLLDELKFTT